MATYRYARDSKTNAQREAAKWQAKVDTLQASIEYYSDLQLRKVLTDTDRKRWDRQVAKLEALLSDNPNEA